MQRSLHFCVCLFLILSFLPGHGQAWRQFEDSADKYYRLNDFDKTIEFKEKANRALKHDSAGTLIYSKSCRFLGVFYENLPDNEKAKKFFYAAMEAAEKAEGKRLEYADNAMHFGLLKMKEGNPEIARFIFKEAMEGYEVSTGKKEEWLSAGAHLATAYGKIGKYNDALTTYKSILPYIYTAKNPVNAGAFIHGNLGLLYLDMGYADSAKPLLISARDDIRDTKGPTSGDYATATNNLADYYLLGGDYEQAEQLFSDALAIRRTNYGNSSYPCIESINNLSNLYMELGQYQKAYESLHANLDTIRYYKLDHHPGFRPVYAQCLANLASVEKHRGYPDSAIAWLRKARDINYEVFGKISPQWLTCSENLGNLLGRIGLLQEAEKTLVEVKNLREQLVGVQHIDYANACNSLGCFLAENNMMKYAVQWLQTANRIYKKQAGEDHILYERSCRNLEHAYWQLKLPAQASRYLDTALASRRKILARIFRFSTEKQKEEYLENIASTNDDDQSFFFNNPTPSQAGQAYDLALGNRNLILNATSRLKQQLNITTDTSARSLYEQWMELRSQLAQEYAKPRSLRPVDLAAIEDRADGLESRLSRLTAGADGMGLVAGGPSSVITWKDIRKNLRTGEAAIEFVSFRLNRPGVETDSVLYLALLLRHEFNQPISILLFTQDQFNQQLNLDNSPASLSRLYRDTTLYHLCWWPIEKYLDGIKTIYFAPSGSLFRVSFAAIAVSAQQTLNDRYKLIQLNSTASILQRGDASLAAGDSIFLFGGIDYNADSVQADSELTVMNTRSYIQFDPGRGGAWRMLPGTKREIEAIFSAATGKGYVARSFDGSRATETRFKALGGLHSPTYIHVATHGFFFPDPVAEATDQRTYEPEEENKGEVFMNSTNPLLRSALLFAGANRSWEGKRNASNDDGILTAYEISNLYFAHTKLVVLSACETALGAIEGNEGVYGLQRAFKIAGVPVLVMSLWQVPDRETAEFMSSFSAGLFSGLAIHEAFYQAQSAMKLKYRNDPYKWAAWILTR